MLTHWLNAPGVPHQRLVVGALCQVESRFYGSFQIRVLVDDGPLVKGLVVNGVCKGRGNGTPPTVVLSKGFCSFTPAGVSHK